MLGNPASFKGGAGWLILGVGGALAALLVASFFPSIIPGRATNVRL